MFLNDKNTKWILFVIFFDYFFFNRFDFFSSRFVIKCLYLQINAYLYDYFLGLNGTLGL
jgi:hypothetical protein